MPTITEYRPAYFSGFDNEVSEFTNAEDLVAIPWIASKAKHENFHRFSISGNNLMAEYDEGYTWYVIGTLSDDYVLELPVWEQKHKASVI